MAQAQLLAHAEQQVQLEGEQLDLTTRPANTCPIRVLVLLTASSLSSLLDGSTVQHMHVSGQQGNATRVQSGVQVMHMQIQGTNTFTDYRLPVFQQMFQQSNHAIVTE